MQRMRYSKNVLPLVQVHTSAASKGRNFEANIHAQLHGGLQTTSLTEVNDICHDEVGPK